jgi:hypothetical protein
MREMRRLRAAFTSDFLFTTGVLAAAVTVGLGVMFLLIPEPDKAADAVQALVTALAVLIGACWALNRYFVTRVDEIQLRVDTVVDCVPAAAFAEPSSGLLLVRADVVNTGKVLIEGLRHALQVQTVRPRGSVVVQEHLVRIPAEGVSGPSKIEPGSWAAINFAHPIGPEVRAVWILLEMQVGERRWTWHRTFKLPSEAAPAAAHLASAAQAAPGNPG